MSSAEFAQRVVKVKIVRLVYKTADKTNVQIMVIWPVPDPVIFHVNNNAVKAKSIYIFSDQTSSVVIQPSVVNYLTVNILH